MKRDKKKIINGYLLAKKFKNVKKKDIEKKKCRTFHRESEKDNVFIGFSLKTK